MVQNRNKLIDLFIGNVSNSIIHEIFEKSIDDENISSRYEKELTTSFNIAKKYREKINPIDRKLPDKDIECIKTKITNKIRSELLLRISKGYENIDLDLIEELVNRRLKSLKIL